MDKNRLDSSSYSSLEKQEALLQLLLEEEGLAPSRQQIPLVSREGDLPVSFAQQRLWFLDQWKPGNPAYNIPFGLEFHGPLDQDVLQECLSQIVARHESLRTTFPIKDGQPLQLIGAVEPFVGVERSWSPLPEQSPG